MAPLHKAQAAERAIELMPVLRELQSAGLSARGMALERQVDRLATLLVVIALPAGVA